MKTGRKPKPTTLKRLHGTFNATRDGRRKPEPLAPGDLAAEEPPAHLTDAQKARWRWALERAPRGILRSIDREALVAFVVAGDLVEQANAAQQLHDRGKQLPFLTKGDRGQPMLSPYVKLMLRAVPMLLRAASELAFTPVSRVSMTIDDGAGKSSAAEERWKLFDSLGPKKSDQAKQLLAAKPASAQPQ
jgi:phage terminase small subunit